MPKALEIIFPTSSGLHRVRNLAEELSLSLGNLGVLPMAEADRATTKIVVSNIHARRLGRCKQLVARLLKEHLMTAEATITILSEPS
jgi:hypothetical protein